jgi:hypothetical protein
MDELITKGDLLAFQQRVQETIDYYQTEIMRLEKRVFELEHENGSLMEQLKNAINLDSGIGFAN